MSMLITTMSFFALTVLCVVHHLKRTSQVPGNGIPAPTGQPCPRCGTVLPDERAAFCPGCGVPKQVYEVVSARTVSSESTDDPGPGRHAVVRSDVCIGCGTCVASCPNDGALRLAGNVSTVDLGACDGVGTCAEACPTGAIAVTTAGAAQRIRVPDVGADFETAVSGLYVVGELGGRGLIKNAINEGKIAVEHIVGTLYGDRATEEKTQGILDVVIVGSGPAGMSAGLEAHRSGLDYCVLEQGALADTIRKYPRRKLLLAEPVKIPLYGDLWVSDTSKESLLNVWETIVANTGLRVHTRQRVENVVREGGLFRVCAGGATYVARKVVLALGRRGSPRTLGVPGEELDKVIYDVVEMEPFKGRRVLVVGGGDSAVESALGLSNQEGTEVTLSYRGEDFRRVKERNIEKLRGRVSEEKIKLLIRSKVREIHRDRVVLDIEGETGILPNDDVIVRIGGIPPYSFLDKIGVRIIDKDVPMPGNDAATG